MKEFSRSAMGTADIRIRNFQFLFLFLVLVERRQNGVGHAGNHEDDPAVLVAVFDPAPDEEDDQRKHGDEDIERFAVHSESLLLCNK